MRLSAFSLLLLPLAASVGSAQVLVDFQVAQPPPLPQNAKQCTVQLFQHTFAFSFGAPEEFNYTVPKDCGPAGSWAGISLNLTVTSNGSQFDRLGIFTFQSVEIWRTSTPEPIPNGIIWTYLKDVTKYIPLFAKPGLFIFQLDNLIETGLNGEYATTLSATFFASSPIHPPAPKADLILPISTGITTDSDDASVPPDFSVNLTFPTNTVEAYVELFASGNGDEEFWYFSAANQFVGDLPAGTALGNGPFREVRLLVDGKLAGAAFPYAVIFTGGIVPPAWMPITSYGALDLPTYVLDLTPFVPILVDGKPHNITLSVSSAETNHAINQNWFVSGNVQIKLDSSKRATKGKIIQYEAQPFAVTKTTGSVGSNGDVNITVKASRTVHIEAEITSGSGKFNKVVFSQSLSYSNVQQYLDNTFVQNVFQTATGSVLSTHNGVASVIDDYSYPLNINFDILSPDGSLFKANFDHSYDRTVLPAPFILGSTIKERQLAFGIFQETSSGNFGNGTSNNTFSYNDRAGNTYDREVNAAMNVITSDHQGGSLAPGHKPSFPPFPHTGLPLGGMPRIPGFRFHLPTGNP